MSRQIAMGAPARIQRRRTKGWRAPDRAVYVGRPSKWGNPFPAYDPSEKERATATLLFANLLATRASGDGEHLMPYPSDAEIREHLAGRDLMCWCPPPEPGQPDHCHAAVLLRVANGDEAS